MFRVYEEGVCLKVIWRLSGVVMVFWCMIEVNR